MFCNECGTRNNEDSKHCTHCGTTLKADTGPEPVDVLLEHSYQAKRNGDTEKALALCKLVLIKNPNHTTALALMGQLYESLGNTAEAIAAFEQVVRLNPGSVADRVRLDELKGEGKFTNSHPSATDTIFYPQQRDNTLLTILLVTVLVLALLGTGAALVIALYQHQTRLAQTPANLPAQTASRLPAPSQSRNNAPAPAYPLTLPPTIIYAQPPAQQSPAPAVITPLPSITQPAKQTPVPAPSHNHTAAASPEHLVIDVGSSHSSHNTAAAAPSPANSHISISVGGSAGTQSLQPDHTSRSYLAMAENEQLAAHYRRAISAYQDSLPTAGDETGFIYQQIGACYQKLGDSSMAVQSYQNAIASYNKLINANHQTTQAKAGILVCEASIKACTP